MSAAEPVSAFGAFRSAKEKADNKRNKKQTAKKDANGKNAKGKQTGKAANSGVKEKSKPKNVNKNKTENNEAGPKKANGNTKAKALSKRQFKDSEVVGLVEELMGDPSKKLSKAQLKKKQDLEQYLVEQLEKDDQGGMREADLDTQFESESDLGSDEYSGEYTIDESGTDLVSGSESGSGTESGSDMDDSFTSDGTGSSGDSGEPSPNVAKNNKRKFANDMGTTNKSTPLENGDLESKKAKSLCMRKSLPAQTKEVSKLVKDNKKQKRNSLDLGNAKENSGKITVKLEPLSPPKNITKIHSIEEGKRAFQWLINPIKVEEFFSKYWENKSCLIRRQQKSYLSHLISFEAIDQMLLQNHVEFTKNIDVTSYKNGIRETHNPEGRALPPVVWDHYGQGCSIRLLNPQTFLPNLYSLSTTMQEYFHCLVGANAYLTPPNSQGFAPHYDDIEAFVLQIEGRKRWKLYKPRNSSEVLPRYSSRNFDQKEIGKPILEEVLEPGDVLYFPRGTIHQACTEPGYHSLHLTLSVYQKQSFADLFEKMLPLMVKKAIESNVELRRGLPLFTWQNAGLAFSDISSKERNEFQQKVTKLMQKCLKEMPLMDIVDASVDQCAKKFQHEALPPEILSGEKLRTVFGSRSRTNEKGECICDYDIDERTNVRLLRANILRLVEEEEKIRIYYYLDNSKEYCEYEPNFIEIEALEAASIEILIKSYPSYVGVSQLPLSSDEKKITLVTALWERGLLMMEKPFK